MQDTCGNPIEEGDLLVQGSGEWGLYFYRVRRDPEQTKRLHAYDFHYKMNRSLSKKAKFYLNLTKTFGERFTEEEIIARVKEKDA